jgi:phospholipid/cholesterol/gamma-HCH transport system substrate-binding protein
MDGKKEQAFVGLFVLVAVGLLLVTIFSLTGFFSRSQPVYHARFAFAGGLEPGAEVRYAGGPKTGRVTSVVIDPNDSSLIDVSFSADSKVPVKADSHVRIQSLSPLGENHIEIVPGSPNAQLAPPGTYLQADPYTDFNALAAKINDLAPSAQKLIESLNDRVTELKVTLARVNDLLNDKNRENISASIAEIRGMLAENRAQIKETLANLDAVSKKAGPLLDNVNGTVNNANKTITHVDGLITENQPEIRASIVKLHEALLKMNALEDQLNRLLTDNSDNIDATLENLRQITDNLNDLTDTLKTRPSALINSSSPRDRKPGDPK